MDGRGRAFDNIFIERLWRSVKYEEVYLYGYETVAEARAGLDKYFKYTIMGGIIKNWRIKNRQNFILIIKYLWTT